MLVFALTRILIVLVVLIVVLLGAVYFFQEKLIFVPSALAADFKFQFKTKMKEIVGETDHIHSILFTTENPRGLFVYLHGNANNLSEWGEVAVELSERTHFNVIMLDYPGYGKSLGSISSEAQLYKMAQDFLERAKKELAPGQKLVIYGRSIGTGLAAKLASDNQVDGLILETPYMSMRRVVKERAPLVPSFILKYQLRSDEWLPKVKSPILMVHGTNDRTIPLQHAKDLAPLNKNVQLVVVPGAGHSDLSNYSQYWEALANFLGQL